MSYKSENVDKTIGRVFEAQDVDVAAHIVTSSEDDNLDPQVALRLRRKIDLHLMPLMGLIYLLTAADKSTLAQSAILGIFPDTHMSKEEYNWLGTIFFLSYLLFEYPQNLALQRFPVGKWISFNILLWSIALLSHAACKTFGQLFFVRFILGACEGAILPGFLIVTSMFYTREEQNKRVGYWFMMNGTAFIVLGFTSFGVAHTKTSGFAPWKWLMVVTGLLTFVAAILFWFFFPDSPSNAHFLSREERALAVQRIKSNQAGVENKRWKKEQFVEAVSDPKTWLLFLYGGLSNVFTSLANQRQIVVNQFGFSFLQTTLLGCVDGIVTIGVIFAGVALSSVPRIGRSGAAAMLYIPAIIGAILVETLPFKNKIGLLFSYWASIFSIAPFVTVIGWANVIVAGHTKRTTVNGILFIAYGLGNACSLLMWKEQYAPRNRIPWTIIAASDFMAAVILLVLRFILSRENMQRDKESRDETYDDAYIKKELPDGKIVEVKVDKAFLDLTDLQNRDFRYVL